MKRDLIRIDVTTDKASWEDNKKLLKGIKELLLTHSNVVSVDLKAITEYNISESLRKLFSVNKTVVPSEKESD